MTDCIILLSRIVQSRKRARIWKTTRKKFPDKTSRAMLFNITKSLQLQQVISIIRSHWRFQRQTSIVSSFWFFIAIMTSQKRQNDWKSLRNLSKHSCEMNFSYFIFKSSSNHSRTMISIFAFRCRHQKSKYQEHFQELIERRLQQKQNRIFLSRNHMTISIWRFFNDREIASIAKSHDYNVIQNQNDDRKFTFDKVNKKSIKIHCIVDVSIMKMLILQKLIMKKQQLNQLIIFDRVHIV